MCPHADVETCMSTHDIVICHINKFLTLFGNENHIHSFLKLKIKLYHEQNLVLHHSL